MRRDRRGVSPVMAEMLMVITTATMGAAAYLMYAAIADQAASVPPAFLFRASNPQGSQVPDYCCLNDTIVDVISTVGPPQEWGPAMEYTINNADDGSLMMQGYLIEEPQNLTDIYLGVYWGSPDEASIINLWFSDIDRDTFVSPTDHLSLRGMSKEFHGAVLRVVSSGRVVGTQVLP